jgi:hypothetical protein
LLLLLLGGCARKLPGPDECRAFALAAVGVEPGTPASALVNHQRLAQRADEVTRECLTVPWDYQLLNCLQNGGSSRLCLASFRARSAGAQ